MLEGATELEGYAMIKDFFTTSVPRDRILHILVRRRAPILLNVLFLKENRTPSDVFHLEVLPTLLIAGLVAKIRERKDCNNTVTGALTLFKLKIAISLIPDNDFNAKIAACDLHIRGGHDQVEQLRDVLTVESSGLAYPTINQLHILVLEQDSNRIGAARISTHSCY